MIGLGRLMLFLVMLVLGFAMQYWWHWSPRLSRIPIWLAVLFLPPLWSLGLSSGIGIAGAFWGHSQEGQRRPHEQFLRLGRLKLLGAILLVFSGYLLVLVWLWRLKQAGGYPIPQREIMAWLFLVLTEVCILRAIAQENQVQYRTKLGLGIALGCFLLLLIWVYPLGLKWLGLILLSLLIIFPVLLNWVDRPVHSSRGIYLEEPL